MITKVRSKLRSSDGASAVEYALLIAAIAAIIVAIVFVLGGRVKSAFSATNSCISVSGQAAACGGTGSGNNNNNDDDNNDNNNNCHWDRGRWVCH